MHQGSHGYTLGETVPRQGLARPWRARCHCADFPPSTSAIDLSRWLSEQGKTTPLISGACSVQGTAGHKREGSDYIYTSASTVAESARVTRVRRKRAREWRGASHLHAPTETRSMWPPLPRRAARESTVWRRLKYRRGKRAQAGSLELRALSAPMCFSLRECCKSAIRVRCKEKRGGKGTECGRRQGEQGVNGTGRMGTSGLGGRRRQMDVRGSSKKGLKGAAPRKGGLWGSDRASARATHRRGRLRAVMELRARHVRTTRGTRQRRARAVGGRRGSLHAAARTFEVVVVVDEVADRHDDGNGVQHGAEGAGDEVLLVVPLDEAELLNRQLALDQAEIRRLPVRREAVVDAGTSHGCTASGAIGSRRR
eukprot:6172418-Pleurochrysis_carterae.AAC.1